MALVPSTEFPWQIDTSSDPTGYPLGKARNRTSPADSNGTPLTAAVLNDIWGFHQALLAEASVAPSGNPDKVGASQYLDAIKSLLADIKAMTPGAGASVSVPLTPIVVYNPGPSPWTFDPTPFAWAQPTTTAATVQFQLAGWLPVGSRISAIHVVLDGASGHAGLPASKPNLTLSSQALAATSNHNFSDPSANVATYEAAHTVSSTLPTPIDVVAGLRLFLSVTGESGANAVAGLHIRGIYVTVLPPA